MLIISILFFNCFNGILSEEKIIFKTKFDPKPFIRVRVENHDKSPKVSIKKYRFDAVELDTWKNKVKIKKIDGRCLYAKIDPKIPGFENIENVIVCKSGKVFKNVKREEGSSTGTPPHLMYDDYIGYMTVPSQKTINGHLLPGSGRRTTFLK